MRKGEGDKKIVSNHIMMFEMIKKPAMSWFFK